MAIELLHVHIHGAIIGAYHFNITIFGATSNCIWTRFENVWVSISLLQRTIGSSVRYNLTIADRFVSSSLNLVSRVFSSEQTIGKPTIIFISRARRTFTMSSLRHLDGACIIFDCIWASVTVNAIASIEGHSPSLEGWQVGGVIHLAKCILRFIRQYLLSVDWLFNGATCCPILSGLVVNIESCLWSTVLYFLSSYHLCLGEVADSLVGWWDCFGTTRHVLSDPCWRGTLIFIKWLVNLHNAILVALSVLGGSERRSSRALRSWRENLIPMQEIEIWLFKAYCKRCWVVLSQFLRYVVFRFLAQDGSWLCYIGKLFFVPRSCCQVFSFWPLLQDKLTEFTKSSS